MSTMRGKLTRQTRPNQVDCANGAFKIPFCESERSRAINAKQVEKRRAHVCECFSGALPLSERTT